MIQFYTLEEVKAHAKKLLEETDYTVLPDVNLTNKNEFVDYRNLIRILYTSPRLTSWWPEKPKAVWGASVSLPMITINQPNTDIPTE